ncbi:MAG: hypothetical protein ABSE86_27615 [Bryobacteraceae bacterium]|jgi:hypothetical protein
MQTFVAVLPYLLLAANTVLLLALFIGINQRVRKIGGRSDTREAALEKESIQISNVMRELNNRIAILEREDRQLGSPETGASGLNSALRGKVLKMYRLGQPADRISEVLRVPRGEVDLLVKVHTLVMRTYQGEARLEQDPEPVKKG